MVELKEVIQDEPKRKYRHIAVRSDVFRLFRQMRKKYSNYTNRNGGDNAFLKDLLDEFNEVPDV